MRGRCLQLESGHFTACVHVRVRARVRVESRLEEVLGVVSVRPRCIYSIVPRSCFSSNPVKLCCITKPCRAQYFSKRVNRQKRPTSKALTRKGLAAIRIAALSCSPDLTYNIVPGLCFSRSVKMVCQVTVLTLSLIPSMTATRPRERTAALGEHGLPFWTAGLQKRLP